MIHVAIRRRAELEKWYTGKLVSHIRKRPAASIPDASPMEAALCKKLNSLTDAKVRQILTGPRAELLAKNAWIAEYVRLCEFCGAYPAFRSESKGKAAKDVKADRAAYLERYRSGYLDEILSRSGLDAASAAANWTAMDALKKAAAAYLARLNGGIAGKFDYGFLDDLGIRGELAERMDLPVCPYCNKQYIQAVTIDGSPRYLGDLDHVRPKSVYQLFSLSLWNLIPCCKSCNQTFKGDNALEILNPHEAGFGDGCILRLAFRDAAAVAGYGEIAEMAWSVEAAGETGERIRHNLELFRLNETYQAHRADIQLALKRRYLASAGYWESVRDLLKDLDGGTVPDEKLLYGVSLDPEKFQDEPLSKAIYDAVKYN